MLKRVLCCNHQPLWMQPVRLPQSKLEKLLHPSGHWSFLVQIIPHDTSVDRLLYKVNSIIIFNLTLSDA